jgi:hypothetical protein
MNLDKRKKELKDTFFTGPGMIIITLLGLFGLGIIIFALYDFDEPFILYDFISKYGMEVIFGSFFIFITLLCWYMFFINMLLPIHKDVLYLVENGDNNYFIDKKGKKVIYIDAISKEPNKFYEVYRTINYVLEINHEYIGEEPFKPVKYESYWLNLYLINGEEYKDLLLLPILYVAALPGLLCFFMARETAPKIVGLLIAAVPIISIIYDLIRKIMNKR